jgi:hypothetical protein
MRTPSAGGGSISIVAATVLARRGRLRRGILAPLRVLQLLVGDRGSAAEDVHDALDQPVR